MVFSLAPFVGDGSDLNPFRPDVAGSYSIIDLRGDATQQSGWCLLSAGSVPSGATDLGELDAPPPQGVIQGLKSALGVTLGDTSSLRAVIVELLLLHGSFTDPGRWNPLRAMRDGWHRIHLGGLVFEASAVVGATFTDDFNRANENLGVSANWKEVNASWAVASNELDTIGGGQEHYARCEVSLDSDDHYAQVDALVLNRDAVSCRNSTPGTDTVANSTFYLWRWDTSSSKWQIHKRVTGTFTLLDDTGTTAPTAPYTQKIEADGSTIKGYLGGVEETSITDTSITGNFKTGLRTNDDVGRFDNFETGDLFAGLFASVDDDPATPTDTDWINNEVGV